MLAPNRDLEGLYDEAYRQAYDFDRADAGQGYYYVADASEYSSGALFDQILKRLTSSADKPVTILDIGSGDDTFLESKVASYGEEIRAIGISAVSQFPAEGVTHVSGDLLRPSTWLPDDILSPGSVDLAVSNLAFLNLIDPLRGLANVLPVIRPGGFLITDQFSLRLDVETRDQTLEMLLDDLGALGSPHGSPDFKENGELIKIGGVFGANSEEPFKHIAAVINADWTTANDWSEKIIYSRVSD